MGGLLVVWCIQLCEQQEAPLACVLKVTCSCLPIVSGRNDSEVGYNNYNTFRDACDMGGDCVHAYKRGTFFIRTSP